MSKPTVGLHGHTGRVGTATFQNLLAAHNEGSIHLIVLHRPSSDTSMIPENVERRQLDLPANDVGEMTKAVEGINTLISTVGVPGIPPLKNLYPVLKASPDFVTYVPPLFSGPWISAAAGDERLLSDLQPFVHAALGAAEEQGLAITQLCCGVFTDFFFDLQYLGSDFQNNFVCLPDGAEKAGLALSSAGCLAEALAIIARRPPRSLVGKTFDAYDYYPTGAEVIATFTKLHGSPTEVEAYTAQDYEQALDAGGMAVSSAGYRKTWGGGDWKWRGERIAKTEKSTSFEELAKGYMK